ncbi:hypothetical protein [Curtobacterium sp. Leaf154]|uniref:hypothetical protein n=1 Tax=Curtobacterium sp. Leaf154 TaxID=1736277 RepID=UPI0006F1D53C|nr:hypothetical protein [Curtobacterium sp. Leaf154]KQR26751.1 hypothetical protein ASF75_15715 [Curtobacterium sp. Leaf154]
MSQQFAFWRTSERLDSAQVYERLVDGEHVSGLEALDHEAVEAALIAAFPHWAVEKTRADGADQTMLAGPGNRGAIDVSYSPQMVTTTCYGMDSEQWNVVISAVVDLRLPLYDPQISYRFDGYE